jgi:hypothetical protein
MLFDPIPEELADELELQIRHAQGVTPGLMSKVVAQASKRLAACTPSSRARVDQLVESGAGIDAALALVELELPQWKLRRLVYEDNEWLCSLSRQPDLPLELAETADARHEVLSLAILLALFQARRAAAGVTRLTSVPQVHATSGYAVCCDNFA